MKILTKRLDILALRLNPLEDICWTFVPKSQLLEHYKLGGQNIGLFKDLLQKYEMK